MSEIGEESSVDYMTRREGRNQKRKADERTANSDLEPEQLFVTLGSFNSLWPAVFL